jgi:murein DD-endopeptidase MepM/ murein hydrolase activator NlpD
MPRLNSFLCLIACMLILIPAGGTFAQSAGPTYIVQEGDSIWGIAQAFAVDPEALAAVNNLGNGGVIYPGMSLVIPGFEGVSGVLETRPVAFGEDLKSLSLRYGLDEADLARLNRVVSPERLYLNQPLIVPVSDSGGLSVPAGRQVMPLAGESALETAVRLGESPWQMRAYNRELDKMWQLPDVPQLVPGGASPPTSLPASISSAQVSPDILVQGRSAEIHFATQSTLWLQGSFDQWRLHFNTVDDTHQVALQGVYALLTPGMYDMELEIFDHEGGSRQFVFVQPVEVASGGYPSDPILEVPPETIDPAVTGPEDDLVASVVSQVTPERQWNSTFAFPGPYTKSFPSLFGSRRNYNGTGYTHYHSGLDFYGGTGTPITAPAAGRVVLAEHLTVRGNATIIDHGWGVFTAYFHQSEIDVKVGDQVAEGQTIGLVGATGRVTGPHLHWEVWVGGVPVNPLEWTAQTFP